MSIDTIREALEGAEEVADVMVTLDLESRRKALAALDALEAAVREVVEVVPMHWTDPDIAKIPIGACPRCKPALKALEDAIGGEHG